MLNTTPDGAALTVLRAHDERGRRRYLAKRFDVATIGTVIPRAYDSAKWFTAETVPLAGIRGLHRLLLDLEPDPHACIIRGAAVPGTDLERVRKVKVENGGAFAEVPRHWKMLDLDEGIPLPPASSILADPAEAARVALDALAEHAPELEGVTAVVRFSASAGLDELAQAEALDGTERAGRWNGVAKAGIRAHVYIWLREALGQAELKRWAAAVNARAGCKLIDLGPLHTVQPHYTAAPVFAGGLRDPLEGRRTVLVEGAENAAELRVPVEAPRQAAEDGAGGAAAAGRGFAAYLAEIGPDGFHWPIVRAVSSFVATNWPKPDKRALKAILRKRIHAADPGGRTAAEIADRAGDRHLDGVIAWAMGQERRKRAVAPTFPDRGVPLAEAERRAAAAVAGFADRLRAGEVPELLLRLTVGGGKSQAAIAGADGVLDAARAGGREGALFFLTPRHDLNKELRDRFAEAHPGLAVRIWRGMEAADPERHGRAMCLDLDLPRAAAEAGLPRTEPCVACPLREACGYRRQGGQPADVWLAAHNLAFGQKPGGLPDAAALVVDESFYGAASAGMDPLHRIELPLSDLMDDRTGAVTGLDRQRLLFLRGLALRVLERHGEGGLLREAFAAEGLTAEGAGEWLALEWRTKPEVELKDAAGRDGILERLREAQGAGFRKLRPALARAVRELLEGDAARSVGAEVVPGGKVRFAWREDFAAWCADAPKLFLDATTAPEVVRQWAPRLEVADIEVRAPLQWVRQVAGREFGRAFFTENKGNVGRAADFVAVRLAEAAAGEVLVVAQQAVEEALAAELRRRVAAGRLRDGGKGLPARLHLAHHGAVTGLNAWERVEHVIVFGRPAQNRREGERLAEVVAGRAVEVVAEDDGSRWPTVAGGIRMADGTGTAVRQPRHPDPLVEGMRWSVTEGAVLQAIGRARGVRRPVRVDLFAELALPLAVAEVVTWEEAVPDRLAVAAAEAALTGTALPLAPADLAAARPDLWPSAKAVELDRDRCRFEGPQTLIEGAYKGLRCFKTLQPARYRKGLRGRWSLALVPPEGGRDALEARVGPLAAFETANPQPAAPPALEEPAAMPITLPLPEPPEAPRLPPAALGLKRLRPMLSPVLDSFAVRGADGEPLLLRTLRHPRKVAAVLTPLADTQPQSLQF